MGRDSERACLVFRVCVLLAALGVCLHLYLWRGGTAPPPSPGKPGRPGRTPPQATAGGEGGAAPDSNGGGDAALKRRVTYVRTLKRDAKAVKEGPTGCCPPLHPRKKVSANRERGVHLGTGCQSEPLSHINVTDV